MDWVVTAATVVIVLAALIGELWVVQGGWKRRDDDSPRARSYWDRDPPFDDGPRD
jgi:hypothetical protein